MIGWSLKLKMGWSIPSFWITASLTSHSFMDENAKIRVFVLVCFAFCLTKHDKTTDVLHVFLHVSVIKTTLPIVCLYFPIDFPLDPHVRRRGHGAGRRDRPGHCGRLAGRGLC